MAHSHPIPSAGYILSGELTIEKKDGTEKHFVAGQAVSETVDSIHRGITGAEPLVVIVFYPGTPGLPVSSNDHYTRLNDQCLLVPRIKHFIGCFVL